ncbi:unnamed protein product [Brachionus calyciflorus]|uniref:Uncharacterized protein n=1 Tax=Brachionus calyciflorus TaxID=104777 RepID=A0A814REC3_9BILA|nr:unnamed protein product [Brachionus calyciflorus]
MSNSSIQQINNSSLGLLKNLEFINLENNDLTCLGDCLNDLNNLKYLNLSGNCLNKINLNLENLEYLNLGKYQVVYLEQETFNLPRLKFLILNTKKLPKYLLRASELQRLEVYGLNSLDDYIFTNEHISSLDYLSLDFSIDQNISSFSKATFQGLNNLKLFRMSLNLEENSQMTNGFVNLFDQLMATKSNDVQPKKFIQFRNNRQFCIQISQIKSENNYLENILNVSQSVKRILIKNVSN